jgi:hypothetical protein
VTKLTSPFETVWRRVLVRELAAGRYEFHTWSAEQTTGVGTRSMTPKKAPPPLPFDVQPGSMTYVENLHADLLWGENIFGIALLGGAVPQVRNEAERDLKLALKDYPQLQGRIIVAPLPLGRWWTD